MSEYLVDFKDVLFCLFEHLEIEKLFEYPKYHDLNRETLEMSLQQLLRMAKGSLAPLNAVADRDGFTFRDGAVTMRGEIVDAFRRCCGAGYVGANADPEWGGQGLPDVIWNAGAEFFTGSSSALCNPLGLTNGAANIICRFGSDELKRLYLKKMYAGEWLGTMALTEDRAGSALGDLSCRAVKEDGHYRITGTKNFVSGGDHNLSENIVHMVLARTDGAPKGIKGISLFLVPKYRVNGDGSIGEPNGVTVADVLEKIGFRGSPTCVLNFGENGDCRGYLIGEECSGIKYMFQMMNESRLLIGFQSLGISGSVYLHALGYAHERVQGSDIRRTGDAAAPPVAIVDHPDVRRMLLMMKAVTEGMRALNLSTALYKDLSRCGATPEERAYYHGLVELMTPVCKAWSSDMGFRVTEWAMQCFGGYGYCTGYPVEQHMRDIKVTSIFEGTNGIQGLDLLGRKIPRGDLFKNFVTMVGDFIGRNRAHPALGENIMRLERAKDALVQITTEFGGMLAGGDIAYPVLHASPYLEVFGDVAVARLLLEQAVVAQEGLDRIYGESGARSEEDRNRICRENSDARFYRGKLCSADFFITQVLPRVHARGESIASGSRSALDIVFEAR